MNYRLHPFVAVLLLAGLSASGDVVERRSKEEAYKSIIQRNPFGLKDPPPPAAPAPTNTPPPPGPKMDIYLTGISTLSKPRKAYIMAREQGKKEEFINLEEHEGGNPVINGFQLVQIDEKQRKVKISHNGAETLLSFETHGIKPPASPAPQMAGAPGVPGAPPVIPQPGMPVPVAPIPGAQPGQPMNNMTPGGGAPTYTPNAMVRTIPSRTPRVQPDVQPGNYGQGYIGPGISAPPPPQTNPNQQQQQQPQVTPEQQYLRDALNARLNEVRAQKGLEPPLPPLPPVSGP